MAKLAIDRASIVFGKQKSGDFHSKSGDREIFSILSKIWRSPETSGDLEALPVYPVGTPLPTGMPTFARALCVISLKIHVNYRSCIYSVATVIQREREALTNMAAAGGLANALSFLWFGILQWQSRNLWNTTARVSEWHLIVVCSAIMRR